MITEKQIVALHEKAKRIVKQISQNEAELIVSIQEIIKYKIYRNYNYPNLFSYLTLALGLSESRAYDFSTVAKAGLKFTTFSQAVTNSEISISKARRIVPVLTQATQKDWLAKAKVSTHRQLERLVATKNPELGHSESYKFVSENQVELKVVMTLNEFNQLKRAQELLCQKQKKQVSLKNTIASTAKDFIQRNDPVEKAARAMAKSENIQKPGTCQERQARRKTLNASAMHHVNYRDQGKCQAKMQDGELCGEKKWIDLHHIKPVYQGGDNSPENLITLCRGHHQMEHTQ